LAYLCVSDGRSVSTNNKGKKLTPKMLTFIDAYFGEANFNAVKAMELSAYKNSNKLAASEHASQLLQHPLVIAEIKRRNDLRAERSEVKAEYLIAKLMQIIEKEQEDNPQAALRAIELCGKSIALWKERQEISGVDGEAIKHEQHVKESVASFTSRISQLAERQGSQNVVSLPVRRGDGGA
jgi:phage terminase small subunit